MGRFADWARHAKHISPTFPPKPHALEEEDDGSWIDEYLSMLPEQKENAAPVATADESSNEFVAMKAKNAINAVYSSGAAKAIFAGKALYAGKAGGAEKALIAGGAKNAKFAKESKRALRAKYAKNAMFARFAYNAEYAHHVKPEPTKPPTKAPGTTTLAPDV